MSSSLNGVPVLTVEHLPEGCSEIIGLVTASCVLSKSAVGDVIANVKNWTIGGELRGYSRMLDQTMELLVERIRRRALEAGATAVIGFRVATTNISSGSAEVIGYGTAVR